MRYNILLSCVIVVLFTAATKFTLADQELDTSQPTLNEATLVWSQLTTSGVDLYFGSYRAGKWQQKQKFQSKGHTNFLPALTMDGKGDAWVAWSSSTDDGFSLSYAVLRDGVVIDGPRLIRTGLSSNIGPHLAYDERRDEVLLAWAGSNGGPDDIYLARYNGKRWSAPQRVNPENTYADYLPGILIDSSGMVTVEWQATLPEEGPQVFSKKLTASSVAKRNLGSRAESRNKVHRDEIRNHINNLPAEYGSVESGKMVYKYNGSKRPEKIEHLGSVLDN